MPKAALAASIAAFITESEGSKVKVNAVDHNTFQENINNYLQGNPDDVFAWFAGYRCGTSPEQGLTGDLSDLWARSTANQRGVPAGVDRRRRQAVLRAGLQLPWALLYRKSSSGERGYTAPTTLDEIATLARRCSPTG